MALTTEQQTSHLSRLQQEVLSWDYFTMDDGQTRSDATRKRALRDVPKTFASVNEYLDVFEPLVLEECAAQISRGDEEETRRSSGSPIGAVFRSTRVDGFHVVQFILGEDAMAGFHDNDLILVSKTDPNDALPERALDRRADADADDSSDATEDDGKAKSKSTRTTSTSVDDQHGDPEGLHNVHALGYVDGRDSRNMMRVRFFLPEPSSAVRSAVKTPATRETVSRKPPGGKRGKDAKENEKTQDGKSEEDFVRFRAVRNALASPKSAWYLTHLANMSTIAREWLALRAFPSLPFAHAILGGKVETRGSKPGGGGDIVEEHAPWELPEPLAAAMKRKYNGTYARTKPALLFFLFREKMRSASLDGYPAYFVLNRRAKTAPTRPVPRRRAGMSNS
jgi:senataxin